MQSVGLFVLQRLTGTRISRDDLGSFVRLLYSPSWQSSKKPKAEKP